MRCEVCQQIHDGSYGTSRFCSQKCAKSSSTRASRKNINQKVSEKLRKFPLVSDDEFSRLVPQVNSWAELFRKLHIQKMGCNYEYARRKALELQLDTSHFKKNKTKEEIFQPDIEKPKRLKEWLIKIGRKYECSECFLGPTWNDKALTIQVDHIDGNPRNNIESNLRFLCPNCHSQTDTFCWKNAKRSNASSA